MSATFRILGPLEVGSGPAPSGKARDLLCLLLIHPNEMVAADTIVDALWQESPPEHARNAVQVVVSRLRSAVGAEFVVSASGGYGMLVSDGDLDAGVFESLVARGRDELARAEPIEAAATLGSALRLWRGPALADVRSHAFAQPEIARLDALHLQCTAERIAAEMESGVGDEVIGELEALVLEHPFDERLRELLMVALYRGGRQTDALEAYAQARRALLDGMGLEPGSALHALQAAVLRHDVPGPSIARTALPDRSPERRRVTCVYARLMHPEGAEMADPERLQTLAGRYHALVETSCERHGGARLELRADGALAAFGLPVAHEDDPLRALRTAVEVRDAAATLGGGIEAAVGVSTGVVVAPTAAAGALFGEPVTVSERLARSRGEIRMPESTRTLVAHAAQLTTTADGSYRLDATIGDVPSIGRRLDRPLVGRSRQIEELRACYELARTRAGWVVTAVVGDAGIGKSRLAAELPRLLPTGTTVLEGRCPPYGEGTTYRPLLDVVLQACGTRTWSDAAAALGLERDVIDRVAATVGLTTGSVGEEAPWAFRRFFASLARELPVVVVIDDAHWAEPGLLDLLTEVTRQGNAPAGLLVYLARPEFQPPGLARAGVIELEPLSSAESRELLAEIGTDLGRDTVVRITETAAGNPLFLEQLATYVDDRRDDGELPPALRGLLAARLDLLTPAERAVLCHGAVQGAQFTPGSLHPLVDGLPLGAIEQACDALVGRELLTATDPLRFRHALIRDAAYDRVSKRDRVRLHEREADRLAAVEDPSPDTAALIGFQLESAHRFARELGINGAEQLAIRARGALAVAAETAHRSGNLPGEVGLLERAIALPGADDRASAALLTALAAALFAAGSFERASAIADRAVSSTDAHETPLLNARAVVERERLRVYQQQATIDVARSIRVVERALETLQRLDDDLGQARAHFLRADLAWMDGDVNGGYASAERMLGCARRAGSGFEASSAAGFMAWGLALGPTPAPLALARCIELEAEFADDLVARLEVAGLRAVLIAMAGRFHEARRQMADSRAGIASLGLTQASAYMALFDCQLETLAGQPEAAERAVRDAATITEETHDRWFQSTVRVDLAHALLAGGGASAAAVAAVEAIDDVPAPQDPEWAIKRHSARALLAAGSGEFSIAIAEAAAATGIADATTMLVFRADAHRARAKVLRLAGDRPATTTAAADALRLYELKGNTAAATQMREFLGPGHA